nr:hypothetical protein [Tanacetum cinerariifolium]
MFKVDRIEVRGTMQGVQVLLVMEGLKTELGLQIQIKQGRLSATIATDVDEQPIQDLSLSVDNIFQADDCDAFNSDVNKAPTAQTVFMSNLSSADHVYDEASPLLASDILSENCVVDSDVDYTSDNNMISYDQYVKDNTESVV